VTNHELDNLLAGQSVYQDVVLAGHVVRRGERDCDARWSLIEPHLPRSGTVLDVGSNFGWFGLRTVATRPHMLVVSAEADERSARVQRAVLQSHATSRVALVTRRASAKLLSHFAARQQRWAAVYCLSVLHWMPDHREFLEGLAAAADRVFLEFPAPAETGVGLQHVRDEIGDFVTYLHGIFRQHDIECLGQTAGLAHAANARSLWKVSASDSPTSRGASAHVDAETLLALGLAWPARDWWQHELARLAADTALAAPTATAGETPRGGIHWTPAGLQSGNGAATVRQLARLRQRLSAVPVDDLFTPAERLRRSTRHLGGRLTCGLGKLARVFSSST